MANLKAIVLVGNLPEGWSGTPQELLEMFAELSRVSVDSGAGAEGGVQIGGDEPLSNPDLIWIDNKSDTVQSSTPQVKLYNVKEGKYEPSYTCPIGSMMLYAGQAITFKDWLDCCDSDYPVKYAVADYPELYNVIGNNYGGTSGVDFYLPDMRGRMAIGVGQGVDYAADKGSLTPRVMGVNDPGTNGDKATSAPGSHPSYLGHDFIAYIQRQASGPRVPKFQFAQMGLPKAGAGGFSPGITGGLPACTVLRWIIKAR